MRLIRGFTLIELIAVMVIVGILAVVAIPRLGNENAFRERGFRDGVAATIGYARRMAVAGRRFVCVNINTTAGQVTLSRDTNVPENESAITCGTSLGLPSQQSGCPADTVCAPSGVSMSINPVVSTLYYDPLGRLVQQSAPRTVLPTTNGYVTISIDTSQSVAVTAQTGYVQ